MKLKLNFDKELLQFFSDTSGLSRIIDIILIGNENHIKLEGDFYKKESSLQISYIPKSKLKLNHAGFEESKFRQNINIGKLFNKIFTEKAKEDFYVKESDNEKFINLYKSYFDRDLNKLFIIEGDDILKYYHESSYLKPLNNRLGTLWKSCMRYPEKNKYMEIYSKNPDKIKMLILLDENNHLKSRALLWYGCESQLGENFNVMDRIYSVFDHDTYFFKDWALKNGFLHKLEQTSKSENLFQTPDGPKMLNLKIKLSKHDLNYYPYIDSFKWYNPQYGILSNTSIFPHHFKLVQNDGSLVNEEQEVMEEDYIEE